MKAFVLLVSRVAGVALLLAAFGGLVMGIVLTPPTPVPSTCPWELTCTVAGIPMWVYCCIPTALLMLITLLVVALARRRQNRDLPPGYRVRSTSGCVRWVEPDEGGR